MLRMTASWVFRSAKKASWPSRVYSRIVSIASRGVQEIGALDVHKAMASDRICSRRYGLIPRSLTRSGLHTEQILKFLP